MLQAIIGLFEQPLMLDTRNAKFVITSLLLFFFLLASFLEMVKLKVWFGVQEMQWFMQEFMEGLRNIELKKEV